MRNIVCRLWGHDWRYVDTPTHEGLVCARCDLVGTWGPSW